MRIIEKLSIHMSSRCYFENSIEEDFDLNKVMPKGSCIWRRHVGFISYITFTLYNRTVVIITLS